MPNQPTAISVFASNRTALCSLITSGNAKERSGGGDYRTFKTKKKETIQPDQDQPVQSSPSVGDHQPIAGEWETKASPDVTGGKRPPTTPSAIASRDYFWATSGPTSAGTAAEGDHRHAYHRLLLSESLLHLENGFVPRLLLGCGYTVLHSLLLLLPLRIRCTMPLSAYAPPALSSRIHHGTSFNPGELPATLHRQ
ncbi:hypothetical protein JMJ77_0008873 [Colletotrichum scovillei]|uniref:Uncharacterized protein n=1 Tax=Colletotrichum scovillei TaxID=1209932 RepID=A0A9P7U862_9PEZI|nr:hypothetical protein JMJ77_0008873 [Colletotrichum scovillei]KAG7061201.1 hypothetical protein JMJ76_0010270 [Colletotrichum scovillei]